jgi:hypothetical protein
MPTFLECIRNPHFASAFHAHLLQLFSAMEEGRLWMRRRSAWKLGAFCLPSCLAIDIDLRMGSDDRDEQQAQLRDMEDPHEAVVPQRAQEAQQEERASSCSLHSLHEVVASGLVELNTTGMSSAFHDESSSFPVPDE